MPSFAPAAIMAILFISASLSMTGDFKQSAPADEVQNKPPKPVSFKLAKPDKPLILLETTVDDKGPFRFVLDTGAGATIVTPELAMKLDIKSSHEGKATGAGGEVDVRHGTVKSLQVGQTRLDGLEVGIMDLTVISNVIETNIDGLIGYNFLKNFRVTIDYPKQTVTFEKSDDN